MATGFNSALANDILDALCKNAALSTIPCAAFYIQLHTADPGAAGNTAIAGNATRKAVTFGDVAASGAISNTAEVAWSAGEVDTGEDYTHWSAWTDVAAGTFIMSGTMTANAVLVGDEFKIPIGDLDISLSTAA